MAEPLARKLLIVGWDAADWKIIDTLLAMGRMPAVRRMINGGVRGELRSLDPMLSPLLWTTIATGKRADKHGILNFVEPDPSGQGLRLSSSTSRKTKALWNILTQNGKRTNVVGWYASHPAEPVNGVLVSNLFCEGVPMMATDPWPMAPGVVHPPEAAAEVADLRMHPSEITAEEVAALIPQLRKVKAHDKRLPLLVKLLAQCASVHNIATWMLQQAAPADCTMVFHEAIDVVGHHFMQYFPPKMGHVSTEDFELYRHVMYGVYQLQDLMLGTLLDTVGPETGVILISDHGFHSDHLRPPVPPQLEDAHAAMDAAWHRPLGVVAMCGPGIAKGKQVYGATLLDIAPTALTILGLPVGADMDGRVLTEAFDRPVNFDRVFTWDAVEGEAGMHPADKRSDSFDAQQSIKQLIDLGYLAALPEDVQGQFDMIDRETKFNLALVYMTSARPREAIDLFGPLVEKAPGEPRYAINLAQCLYQTGQFSKARAALERFLDASPDHPDAKIFLGAAMIAEGKPAEAIPLLEKASTQARAMPDRDCMIGKAYLLLKQPDESEAAYRRAAEADPHSAKAHLGLAQVAVFRGNFDDAIEPALRSVELQHHLADGHYTLGVALTWLKEYEKAIQCFKIAVSMQPGYLDAHRYLMSIYRHLGDRDSARSHRAVVESLIAQKNAGEVPGGGMFSDEAPMGPAEWARRENVSGD